MFRPLTAVAAFVALTSLACDAWAPRAGQGAVFSIRGAMVSNSCGIGAPSSNATLSYNVEIRLDRSTLRWSIPSANISAQAAVDASTRRFVLVDDRAVVLRAANARTGLAACAMRRFDVLEGRVRGVFPALDPQDGGDAGDPLDGAMFDAGDAMASMGDAALRDDSGDVIESGPPALEGLRETIGWAVLAGADCRDFIGVGPGQFVATPCEQSWALDARYEPTLRVSR